jgi:hypothetical protein
VLVLIAVGAFVYVGRRANVAIWILPVVLLVVFTFNAWMVYLADSLEIERHEYLNITLLQFIGILAFSFLLDAGRPGLFGYTFRPWRNGVHRVSSN